MPERARPAVGARSIWSGTITFGLVSIPVNLFAAAQTRQTGMHLVDAQGHALGRQYFSEDGKKLARGDLVRGYETDDGKIVKITDEELESTAPELTRDIELKQFVPADQIPAPYYDHPYILTPAGRSAKAYHLLAATMRDTGKVGVGTFVMRGHQYLVAIVADEGLLRAQTLRFAGEVKTPQELGLPAARKGRSASKFHRSIASLKHDRLDPAELSDIYAARLHELAEQKQKKHRDVVHGAVGTSADEATEQEGKVVDLMKLIRKSLAARATVTTADAAEAAPPAKHKAGTRRPHRAR